MKHLKIVNIKKFIKSISIIFMIILAIILISTKATSSHTEKKHVNYDTIIVSSGDTLWKIGLDQQQNNPYYENRDVREIIQSINNVNDLKTSNLLVGQELKVPVI